MPWINGAWSLFYIGIVAILLVEMLEIKDKIGMALLAMSLVVFPTVTSGFAYMFTADAYMLAFLLVVLGVFFVEKYRFGFIPGMICVSFSMSTYQAYLSVALVLVVVLLIKRLLLEEKTFLQVVKLEYVQGFVVVGGAVLNSVMTKLVNKFANVALSDYQGVGSMRLLSAAEIKEAYFKMQNKFYEFFRIGEWSEISFYSILNSGVFILLLILTIYFIREKKLYKHPLELVCVLIGYMCIPIFSYIIYFVSTEVVYHSLMVMSLWFVYVLLILFIEQFKWEKIFEKITGIATLSVICGICYYHLLNTNYAYFNMNLSYEKSYTLAVDVLERVENLEQFDGTQKIAVMGRYDASTAEVKAIVPEMTGFTNGTFLREPYHYFAFWRYCTGRNYASASDEEMENIIDDEEYLDMKVYPYADCVRMMDDVVVVKLSE